MISSMALRRRWWLIVALVVQVALFATLGAGTASAAGPAYAVGDVFAGIGSGQVKQFSGTGTLLNTLNGEPATFNTGMAFDGAGNLYSTGFDGSISKYDNSGTFLGTFGSGFSNPESIVLDAAGNFYIGQAGAGVVLKLDATGALLTTFTLATESRGTDWIDLAADQCTLFYTSEGDLVKRFDVCTNTQLADFATLPSGEAYALRIRPNGDVLVAATGFVYRLDSTGALAQTYTLTGSSLLFALNLDPDGTSFWTGDLSSGEIYKVDIASGTILQQFNAVYNSALGGLAVFGEITAARSTQVSYTGPASVQYSDAVTLSGHLQTSTGTALSGYQLDFTLGLQTTSGTPTDASGNVSAAPLTVTQQAGSPGVTVDFAGDVANNLVAATTTAAFTIAKENCTLAYTGNTLVNAANMTTLSAQFGEPSPDTSFGDWSGKTITFTVTDASLAVQTFTAVTNVAGVASTTVALGPNVYGVGVSFATDAYYLACGSALDTLVTVQDARAKITGGGWISQGTGNTNFGFNVIRDVTGLKGQLQVRSKGGKDRFHSTSVLTLNTSGNSGTWTGTGRWNNVTGYTFTVSVVDNGTSGKKGDTISIVIKSPTNVTVFTTSGALPLKGGNIVVH